MSNIQVIHLDVNTNKDVLFECYVNAVLPANQFDLTGWTATLTIRQNDAVGRILKTIGVGTGLSIGGTNGVVTWSIVPADTNGIKFIGTEWVGHYELEITNGTLKYRPFSGPIRLRK